jgi:peroxiredoxin
MSKKVVYEMDMPKPELTRLSTGSLLPTFTLRTVEDKELSTWDLKGKKNLVVIVLGKECNQDCRDFLSEVAYEYKRYKELDAEVVAIFKTTREMADDIRFELELPFPVLVDVDGMVTSQLTYHTPAIMVTDRFGEVVEHYYGEDAFKVKQEKLLARVELNELACPE